MSEDSYEVDLITEQLEKEKDRSSAIGKVAVVGIIVNLLLAVFKFVGGTLGKSQAVLADAFHSISDLSTDLALLVGVRFWSAPPDKCHPHGHGRIETLVTVGIGAVLAAVGGVLGFRALVALGKPAQESPKAMALIAAAVSVVIKELLYRWTVKRGREIRSTAVIANAWHHRSDALSSLPVVLAVGVAFYWRNWSFVDRVGALLVSYVILRSSFKIIFPALGELVDRGAGEEVRQKIERISLETAGVKEVHAIRTRYSGSQLRVDLHALVDEDITVREGHKISEELKRRLIQEGPDVRDVVVHIEPYRKKEPDKGK